MLAEHFGSDRQVNKSINGIDAMVASANTLLNRTESSLDMRGNLALADRPQRVRRQTRRAPPTSNVCLVVSPDPLRQMMFGQAAARSGWRQVACADQASALSHLADGTVGLVLGRYRHTESEHGGRSTACWWNCCRIRSKCSPLCAVAPTIPKKKSGPASAELGCTCRAWLRKAIWIPCCVAPKKSTNVCRSGLLRRCRRREVWSLNWEYSFEIQVVQLSHLSSKKGKS